MGVGIAAFFGILQSGKTKLSIDKAYYGMECGKIENINEKYNKYIKIIKKVTYKEIVEDIIKNKIIIWINGNAEIGPRALGNRSLLGDPRYLETKNLLNIIKKRQWWRPVAPIVIDEEGNNYFKNYRYSPYMLLNLKIKEDKKELVPAIIHLDNTARIQSLKRKDNPNLYKLMQEFYNETNIPILCNTSLNDAGEPIINNIEEAIEFALHKGIQSIYVNGQYKITGLYHSREEAEKAEETFKTAFQKQQAPEDTPEIMFDTKMENVGQAVVDAIMTSGNYKSKAEIRRLMKQGAIRINGERVTDIATIQSVSSDAVIQVGKGKFYKLNTEDKKKIKQKNKIF